MRLADHAGCSALKANGKWAPNPLVITDRFLDEYGRMVLGDWKTGEEKDRAKKFMAEATVDLQLLDDAVETCAPSCSIPCRTV